MVRVVTSLNYSVRKSREDQSYVFRTDETNRGLEGRGVETKYTGERRRIQEKRETTNRGK